MRMSRYPLADVTTLPRTTPETDASKVDARALYRQADEPLPERPSVSRLTGDWKKHRSGAFVIRLRSTQRRSSSFFSSSLRINSHRGRSSLK